MWKVGMFLRHWNFFVSDVELVGMYFSVVFWYLA